MAPPERLAAAPAGGRGDFRAFYPVTTRWMDNDAFGHVNNVTYYSYFDTAVTGWLIARGLIGLGAGPMWMVAETGCRFFGQVGFPDAVTVGLRIAAVGRSSVRWELAVFRGDDQTASAQGHFIHVHVDRQTRRPAPVPDHVRTLLIELQS